MIFHLLGQLLDLLVLAFGEFFDCHILIDQFFDFFVTLCNLLDLFNLIRKPMVFIESVEVTSWNRTFGFNEDLNCLTL